MSFNQPHLYSYEFPEKLLANVAVEPRDASKLLVLDRKTGEMQDKIFRDIYDLLEPNDVLVLNNSKVFPARLLGKKDTGGKLEILLMSQTSAVGPARWKVLSRPRLKFGQQVFFDTKLTATVIGFDEELGQAEVEFNVDTVDFLGFIEEIGKTPLPPYIHNDQDEKSVRQRYQTVYANPVGSVAAPTAGLHFTKELLEKIKNKGVAIEYVTLHVGAGTFQTLREENINSGKLHKEVYEIKDDVAKRLNEYKQKGRRIVAVGTTATRTLESAVEMVEFLNARETQDGVAQQIPHLKAGQSDTQLFIYPRYKFNFVDALITNFHIPESSLLMLVSAFVSSPNTSHEFSDFLSSVIGKAYLHAIKSEYRFYSFGDAMFIY